MPYNVGTSKTLVITLNVEGTVTDVNYSEYTQVRE